MNEQEIIKILSEHSDLMQPYNLLGSFLRWLGWIIVKGIKWVVDGASGVIDDIYTMFGFANSDQVNTFIDKFMPFVFILFGIALIFLGYRFILHSHTDQKSNIATNIVLILVILTCTNVFFAQMTELTQAGVKDLNNTYENGSYSDTLIKENVCDLVYLDSINFKYKEGATLNKIKSGNFANLEMGDTVNPDDYDLNNPEVFENRLIVSPDDGAWAIKEIKHGKLNFLPPLYYRYHVSWVTIFLTMLSLAIVLIFTIYKLGRIVFEIAFHKILGLVFAVTDIYEGRRMKEIFKSLMSLFAVVIIINLLLKFYFLFVAYIKVQYDNDSIGALSYGLLLLIAALAVIDGPNIIERVIGIDAGIKSGYQTIIGGMAIGRGLQSVGRSIRDAAIGSPASRSTSVNDDGTVKRNLGGISGVVQRMGRQASGTTESAEQSEDKPSEAGMESSTVDMSGADATNSIHAQDSGTPESALRDKSASNMNESNDINHQSERRIDRSGLDGLKSQDPIQSSIAHSPSGNDKSPHMKDAVESDKLDAQIRQSTLESVPVTKPSVTPGNTATRKDNGNSISQNQPAQEVLRENVTQTSHLRSSPQKSSSSFEKKDDLRIKKEEKKYE